ncbi:MAG TPA: hypothetical protein VIX85_02420 [Acidimicrobiales bacterium]
MATTTATGPDTDGNSSIGEKSPGVWRLPFIVTDNGEPKQAGRIYRGAQPAARKRLRKLVE